MLEAGAVDRPIRHGYVDGRGVSRASVIQSPATLTLASTVADSQLLIST